MKTTFYGVEAEFYDTGVVKVCMTEKRTEKVPRNQFKRKHGLSAFKVWLLNKKVADEMLAEINIGKIDFGFMMNFFETLAIGKAA